MKNGKKIWLKELFSLKSKQGWEQSGTAGMVACATSITWQAVGLSQQCQAALLGLAPILALELSAFSGCAEQGDIV